MASSYQRPAFWRLPHSKDEKPLFKKKVHFVDEVQCGSPAFGELLRGDVISKIGEYDARDLRHEDAQTLFRTAGNDIRLVVHRDNKIAYTQGLSNDSSRCSSTIPGVSPVNFLSPNTNNSTPHRGPSPFLPGPGHYEQAMMSPVNNLPHTVFPNLNESGGYIPSARPDSQASSRFSPMPTRDHQQDVREETTAIINQPYRTTPLILPGAKVKKENMPTQCYLRHHPNPAVRAPPAHDYHDVLMKQKVADSVLHRVVGDDAASGKVFHKQFNSPIGLYSDNNIESTIRQTVPIFIDLSFLEQKNKILEQQQQKQQQEQLKKQQQQYNNYHQYHYQ